MAQKRSRHSIKSVRHAWSLALLGRYKANPIGPRGLNQSPIPKMRRDLDTPEARHAASVAFGPLGALRCLPFCPIPADGGQRGPGSSSAPLSLLFRNGIRSTGNVSQELQRSFASVSDAQCRPRTQGRSSFLPADVVLLTDQEMTPVGVIRSTSPRTRVSQISSLPLGGGFSPRIQGSVISRRIFGLRRRVCCSHRPAMGVLWGSRIDAMLVYHCRLEYANRH